MAMKEEKQLGIPLMQADDRVPAALDGFAQWQFASLFALGWALGQHRIAVRTGAGAEALKELGLECRRDGVLQPLGLFMHLVPLHAEVLAEHSLDQVMT